MTDITRLEITRAGLLTSGIGKIDEERGEWIHVHDGRAFFIMTPRAEDIDIQHIAQGLAKACRFNGQTKDHRTFVSVAQHSVNVSRYREDLFPREKLLHDGSEAYVSDIVRPLKKFMPEFAKIDERVQKAIHERFGLAWPMPIEVLEADNVLLATEKRDFLLPSQLEWGTLPEPLPERLTSMMPDEAYHLFLDRFEELFGEKVPRI